jgi:hypothetical protein
LTIIIILIISINDKTALSEPQPSIEDSVSSDPVFTCLDFAAIFFLQPALRPTRVLEDHVFVFMSPSDRVAQLYLQAPGSLFVASCDAQGW